MSKEQSSRPVQQHGQMVAQKPKNFTKSLAKLFHFMKPYKAIIIVALTLAVISYTLLRAHET